MPYYSELGLYSGPSTSSYTPLFLSGPYSNHSSIVSNNFTRPPSTYTRGFRHYKPHLSTITERRTGSPLRRINSPKVSYTPVIIPRPIKINTADIDVSLNKYRKYDRQRNKEVVEAKLDSKSPSPSRTSESPRSSTELKDATPTANIRRDRATVRLRTIHKDKVMNSKTYRKWRENFQPEELYPEEVDSPSKALKKSPGELLKEKFLIPFDDQPDKKSEKRKSVKHKQGVTKTPSFHDICTAITSQAIDEELNPGQPVTVQRRQSRQFQTEDILKEIKRTSIDLSESQKNVIDTILTKVEAQKMEEKTDKNYDSRGNVKKRKKYNKTHSSKLILDKSDEDSKPSDIMQRRNTVKKVQRTRSSNLDLYEVKKSKENIRENEGNKNTNLAEKCTITSEEKPILKAVIDEIKIEESSSPKQIQGSKLKFNFTVEKIEQNNNVPKVELSPDVVSNKVLDSKSINISEFTTETQKQEKRIEDPKKKINKQDAKSKTGSAETTSCDMLKIKQTKNQNEVIQLKAIKPVDEKLTKEKSKPEIEKLELVQSKLEVEKVDRHKMITEDNLSNQNEKNKIRMKSMEKIEKEITETEKEQQESGLKNSVPKLTNEIIVREEDNNANMSSVNTVNAETTEKEEKQNETKNAISKWNKEKTEKHKVQIPANKKVVVSNVIKKKHTARMGLILEEIRESEERSSSQEKGPKKKLTTPKDLPDADETPKQVLKKVSETTEIQDKRKLGVKKIVTPLKKSSGNIPKEINNNTIKRSESSEDFWKAIGQRESVRPVLKKLELKSEMITREEEEIETIEKEKTSEVEVEKTEIQHQEIKTSIETTLKSAKEEESGVKQITETTKNISSQPVDEEQNVSEKEGKLSEAEMKRIISKRSLIQKAKKEDPDLVVFDPPPEPEPKLEDPKEEKKEVFVPLQSNRLSIWMHPFKKPEQYDECPVEIYARPKTIRKRHFPRGRFGQWERYQPRTSSSDEDSDDSSDSDEDSSVEEPEDENNNGKSGNYGASTSSNDSGFDSGAAKNMDKDCDVNCHKKCEKLTANLCGVNQKLIAEAIESVKRGSSTDSRDAPSLITATNPAFVIDPNEEECCRSSTFQGFQKSGRITPPATTIPRFRKYCVEDFHFLKVLGKGSFGKVLLAELKDTEYYYAIKCLKKDVVLEDDDVECTLIERKVLALGTKHPYLCHLLCTFQTDSHLFFVMEYLNGGDLMFHIQQSGRFSEDRARFYAAEIVSGLKFLHNKGIVYRDLKLDNILLDFDGHVRIADFGMCKLQVFLDRMADTFCGTPDYMAPEIIKGQHYNQSVDWWSFGVLLYEMLLAQSPFSGCDEDELFWSICNEKPVLPRFLSQEASRILSMLLEKDASKRLGNRFSSCGDVKDQPFFKSIDWDMLEARVLEPPFKPKLSHPLDTKYFDKHFTTEVAKLTPIEHHILNSIDQTQFQGFSYTNPNATDK